LASSGTDVLTSDDGGATWVSHSVGVAAGVVTTTSVAFGPSQPGVLYAGARDDGVFRSDDGGLSWEARNHGLPGLPVNSVAVASAPSGTLYVSAGTNPLEIGLYRSSGTNWDVLQPPGLGGYALTLDPADGSTLYAGQGLCLNRLGCFGELRRTGDGGVTWEDLLYGAVVGVQVDPLSSVVIFASLAESAGFPSGPIVGAVMKSTNHGATWIRLDLPGAGPYKLAIDPVHEGVLYAADGGAFRSGDGGSTWEILESGLGTSVIQVVVPSADSVALYAGANTGLFRSEDRGSTWEATDLTVPVALILPDPNDPDVVYASGSPDVYRSGDRGRHWSRIGSPSLPDVTSLALDPSGRHLYAGSLAGLFELEVRRPTQVVAPR
jgi:photosystem II stability/assembly factor-like uncharacterized protein